MITEKINKCSKNIDAKGVEDILRLMNKEDGSVIKAVEDVIGQIIGAVNDAVCALKNNGNLIYIGAGTSGRLAVVDASEMPPTFNVSPGLVRAIIAGGQQAITRSVEGAEDDAQAGALAIKDLKKEDMVIGISASGKAPFVIGALKECSKRGIKCWLFSCNKVEYDFLDGQITVITGPEIVAGSTRLKAGTATKLVLNMISTTAMIKLGRVFDGYMVDVVPSNNKLVNRSVSIIKDVTGCCEKDAKVLFDRSRGNSKTAIVMYIKNVDYEKACLLLEKSRGSLREALAL